MIKRSESLFGHDIVEIISGNFSSVIGSSLQHLLQLGCIHSLTQFFSDSFDIVNIDKSSFIIIEQIKDFINTVLKLIECLLLILCHLIWQ